MIPKMSSLVLLIVLLLMVGGCGGSVSTKKQDSFENVEILLGNWKKDSLGCEGGRLKNYEVIREYCLGLSGSKSQTIIDKLGPPNYRYNTESNRNSLIYVLECENDDKKSFFNLYCHFRNDSLINCNTHVF